MGNGTERISRRRILKLGSLAIGALGAGALLEACGSGGNDNTPASSNTPIHPEATGTPSQTATATQVTETPKPTENNPYGVAPSFDGPNGLSASIDSAIASNGGALPPIAGNLESFNGQLKACNEEGLEGFPPELYATGVIDGCTVVAQVLAAMYQKNPTPEIKKAFDDLRSFTIGKGGKVDQLTGAGKPTSSKEYLEQNFFILTPKG